MNDDSRVFPRCTRALPLALLHAREVSLGNIRDILTQEKITEQKWRVLRCLDEHGQIEQSAISRVSCIQLPSLTRILRALETDKMVRRTTDPDDGRRVLVSIAPEGRALLERHRARVMNHYARLRAAFGNERFEQLLDMLEELRDLDF